MSQPQGSRPPQVPQQFGPPPQWWQHGPSAIPPQQWQRRPPIHTPRYPVKSRPAAGNGWWTASAVLAFLGAASAVSVLGSIAVMAGIFGLFVAAQSGGEGVQQISDDFIHTTTWLFYLFVVMQLVSIVLGLWGGRNCLRGKKSGALMTMFLGGVGVGELSWLAPHLASVTGLVLGVLAAVALIVCPVVALRQPPRIGVPGQPTARPGLG